MKTREELNTEIQISILEELQKKNEVAELKQQISPQEKRTKAVKKLMNSGDAFTAKANAEQRKQLAACYKKRHG